MSDKKNDDYGHRDPENGEGGKVETAYSRSPSPRSAAHSGGFNLAKIDNSPGASVLGYCLSSISMTVVNKYVVSGSSWNMNFLYLAIQSIVCVVVIQACKQAGLITNLSAFDSEKGKKWFPISVLLVGMIYTGAKALQYLSVPVYTIFKNLTIIAIAYGEVLWFGGSVSPTILLSFGLIVLSSIVAAWADADAAGRSAKAAQSLATLQVGYTWMALNVFCQAAFVLGMRKVIKKMGFKDWDTMFYNNFLTIPVLIVGSLLLEDWSAENLARNFPAETRNNLLLGMVYSGVCAIFISYSSAWCIRVTSSTTYSMVGALNKLPIAVSGLIFFDAPVTFGSVSAIIIGFISGLVYTWGKIRQSEKAKMSLPVTKPVMSASSQSNNDANA
ncbi:udp-galactose transporter [Trichoderma arundinaceum]|uniref:GDP-mannose transporter n=1 Tax=Trichoderma arundinaceum TaxID=490622 RepID=A0A395NCH6_TRIAR|nr:udp-galactose transporter [Trichoderma arundinaceum]